VSAPAKVQPLLLVLYRQYLEHQDVDRYLSEVGRWYTQGTLLRLASSIVPKVRRAAVLALGFHGDFEANHVLGEALTDRDRSVRLLAEEAIRKVWLRQGTPEQQRELRVIVRLNAAQHFRQALRRATRLISQSPDLAEAWNQRAIAHFGTNDYTQAIHDCRQALELNPYHFAAATGMGYAYLRLGDTEAALESFRRALRLNPGLEGVRVEIDRLQRRAED